MLVQTSGFPALTIPGNFIDLPEILVWVVCRQPLVLRGKDSLKCKASGKPT